MKAPFRVVLTAIAVLALVAALPAGAEEAPAAVAEEAAVVALDEAIAPLVCEVDLFAPVSPQEPVGDWMDFLREDRFKSPHGYGFCPQPCAHTCPFCPFYQDCPAPSCSGSGACCDYGG